MNSYMITVNYDNQGMPEGIIVGNLETGDLWQYNLTVYFDITWANTPHISFHSWEFYRMPYYVILAVKNVVDNLEQALREVLS